MSSTVFLVDCFPDDSPFRHNTIEIKRKPGLTFTYSRGFISECLEGIDEYKRITCDLTMDHVSMSTVCTGPEIHVHGSSSDIVVGPAPILDMQTWNSAVHCAVKELGSGSNLIIMLRHQHGVNDDDIVFDGESAPITVFESVQSVLGACQRDRPLKLTLIRIASDEEAERQVWSSSCTIITQSGFPRSFPLAYERYVVPVGQVYSACWELCQRHLNLRSINVSGIPMKKTRKQANIGKRFNVSFIFLDQSYTEFSRFEDQSEISSGVVQLGRSQWLARRSKDVFWSHAPANFEMSQAVFASSHLVTPSDLSSPLTLPLMKCVLTPSNYLFFSEGENEGPILIIGLHGTRIYLHVAAAGSQIYSQWDGQIVIPNGQESAIDQLTKIVRLATFRSCNSQELRRDVFLNCASMLVTPEDTQLLGTWKHSKLYSIYDSCVNALINSELTEKELKDLPVPLNVIQRVHTGNDNSMLPEDISRETAGLIYNSIWRNLTLIAAMTQSWSFGHATAAEMIRKTSPDGILPTIPNRFPPKSVFQTFWSSQETVFNPLPGVVNNINIS
uniref:Uncharacterized protein n=1 Tax=Spongospora subterranea TaxID=70186 RepID=A0A0H5R906_9EUKA|eukprot:CRZ10261.1 hypothetical protein [Spongospora subterranea]